MRTIEFDKMQGLGNDYVYIIALESLPENMPELAVAISDRHFGIGGDGMVVVTHSDKADFRMIMFNNDGSEAQMCGNASRCIAKLMYEQKYTDKTEFTLETLAGIKHLKLNLVDGKIKNVSVNMGKPFLQSAEIPVVESEEATPLCVHHTCVGEITLDIHCVGMGNPHGVIFREVTEDYFQKYGPVLECHQIWPEKANIEFIKIIDPHLIEMRVWERGTGETLACGTGACASAVASILTGRTENDITVKMKGGSLNIKLNEEGEVIMTGDAEHVAHGIYYIPENI